MGRTPNKAGLGAAGVLLLGLPGIALAAEGQLAWKAGVGTSNNIDRTVTGARSETIASVGSEFALLQETRRLHANLNGDLSWLDYLDGDYSSELVGNVGATLRTNLVEDLLSWSFVDRFGQTRTDVLAALTPSNRENVNQFATGPDVTLRLGGNLRLLAAGRYMRVSYQDSPFDSQRYTQSLGLQREMSGGASLTLNASTQQIDPQGTRLYKLDEATAIYAINGARTDLKLEAGVVRTRVPTRDDSTTALVRVDITRKFGGGSSITLSGRREYVDAGGSLGGWQSEQAPRDGALSLDLSQTTDPYLLQSLRLGWNIQGRVTSLYLGGSWQDQNYAGNGSLDRRERGLQFRVGRDVGPRLRVGAEFRYMQNDVRGRGDSKEDAAGINFDWRVGRRLSVRASGDFTWFERDTDPGTVQESRYWLMLRYGGDRR